MTAELDLIRSAGLRATAPRLAVLAEVAGRPHATTEQIRSGVTSRLGSVSIQAVYDVLNAFTDVGIVRRFQAGSSPARYELADSDQHDHMVCGTCGSVTDVAAERAVSQLIDEIDSDGFVIDEAQVIYWGTCRSCVQPA